MKKILLTIAAAAGIAAPTAASANLFDWSNNSCCPQVCDPCFNNWYVVGGINHAGVFNHDRDGYRGEESQDWHLGWHVFLGYKFTRCLSLETGYLYHGRQKGREYNNAYDYSGYHYVIPITGQYSIALTRCQDFKALVRLGGHYYYEKSGYNNGGSRPRRTGIDLNFGVGLEYDFNDCFGLRLVLDRYYFNFLSDYDNSLQLSVIWGF
jgi:hypothetical protein